MTAAATTGPAQGPRPASSMPQITRIPLLLRRKFKTEIRCAGIASCHGALLEHISNFVIAGR